MYKVLRVIILLCITISMVCGYPGGSHEEGESGSRSERQAGGGHHNDIVDFGAHTGHKGSFGWYADFPVHSH